MMFDEGNDEKHLSVYMNCQFNVSLRVRLTPIIKCDTAQSTRDCPGNNSITCHVEIRGAVRVTLTKYEQKILTAVERETDRVISNRIKYTHSAFCVLYGEITIVIDY